MTISDTPSSTKYQEKNSPLGNTVNNSAARTKKASREFTQSPANHRTVSRYFLQRGAQKILNEHNVLSARTGNPHATRRCMHTIAYEQTPHITLNSDASASRAGISGLQTCNSLTACPVCSQRIMLEKADDIKRALGYGQLNNLVPIMVTLTAQHHAGMRLAEFRADFQSAWSMFNGSRRWKGLKAALGVQHGIYSREVTHGQNGWHYHMHILLFVPKQKEKYAHKSMPSVREMREYWQKCLTKKGLYGNEHALEASGASANETYLAKFGFTESENGQLEYELTNSDGKSGVSSWVLLERAVFGDVDARMLWIEYVEAMQNHQIITFSNGFRNLFEEIELEHEEIPENQKLHRWMEITPREWVAIAKLGMIPNLIRAAAKYRCKHKMREIIQSWHDEWWYRPPERE